MAPVWFRESYNLKCIIKYLLVFVSISLVSSAEKEAQKKNIQSVRPYAFVRVKNERVTLLASLNSILPAIDRGVIAYNDTDDGSEEIVLKFCKEHPGFKPFKYPYHVEPAHSKSYLGEVLMENRLDTYYNAALDQLPDNAWVIKVDADEVFDAKLLKESFKIIRHPYDVVSYPRINVHVKNNKVFVICCKGSVGIVNPYDHLLTNKQGLRYFMYVSRNPFRAYEMQDLSKKKVHTAKLIIYNFMYLKNWRSMGGDEKIFGKVKLVPLSEIKKRLPINGIEIPPGFLDEERILKIYNSFDLKHLKHKK